VDVNDTKLSNVRVWSVDVRTGLNVATFLNFVRRLVLKSFRDYPDLLCTYVRVCSMTARFFDASSSHTNPLIQAIGNYTLRDLHLQYKKYIHKRT
jgi:hypothetical protein